ncbi:MAG: vanadium-dependent haloperoxidase [Myxococcales bacterium]|nr:vanadium-dependent haloperoxidase [Myxococcales bacterium]
MLAALLALMAKVPAAQANYDFDNGNAAIEVVIPSVAPIIFQDISSTAGDATLVLRLTTLVTNAWFDAVAPYHPTAVGVYTSLGRRPASESATNANLNVALLYASYRVFNSLLPHRAADWRNMLIGVGLDPDDDSLDPNTAVGLGNAAGFGVVAGRINDGMNQSGSYGRTHNPMPYMDYTGYTPVNTAYELVDPSRWQPDIQRKGIGLYKVQQFVTPQYALVEPYSYDDRAVFAFPPPRDSNHRRVAAYKAQADAVLAASASLDDQKKLMAELFDNKIEGLGFSAVFVTFAHGLSLMDFIQLDFLTNMAAFDAGIAVWEEKTEYDAVRPFSAIRHIYGDEPVVAYGGPDVGAVSMPASQWKSYLEEADHPEYPSASTCFCAAHAQAVRNYLGTDVLGWQIPRPAGSSRVEPGVTPSVDTVLSFPTWTDYVEICGQSRVWAGVHFQAAVDESRAICDDFGDHAYEYFTSLVDGTADSPRAPSQGM